MENPPAFTDREDSITVRDYFAAKAMQGYLLNTDHFTTMYRKAAEERPLGPHLEVVKMISRAAYDIADGMMKEREER